MQSFVLRRDCNGHNWPKIFCKNIPKAWWWFDCTRSTCALRAVLIQKPLVTTVHLQTSLDPTCRLNHLRRYLILESFTSKVVIHLCSCLLSVVSVLEVQNGNVQAWAAEQLLDSGRQWEHTALRWPFLIIRQLPGRRDGWWKGNPKQPTRDVYFTWDPYHM